MRILVSPQEFKGTLTAPQAAELIARGVRIAHPTVEVCTVPLADGGPGTVDAFLSAAGGTRKLSTVKDPLGRAVEAAWALIDGGRTAVIEMSAASGLSLLAENERDVL